MMPLVYQYSTDLAMMQDLIGLDHNVEQTRFREQS